MSSLESWNQIELGEVIKLQGGYAFKSEEFKDQGIPVIRISNIKESKIDLSDVAFVDERNIKDDFKVNTGDILIAMSGATTGKLGRYSQSSVAYLNQRVGKFVVKDKSRICYELVYYLTSHESFQKSILSDAAGGAQPNISSSQIESIYVQLPPLNEQNKIAEILISIDRVIELTSMEIDKLKDLQRALEVKLFSELNEEVVNLLGEFSRIGVGIVSGSTDAYAEKGIPFLRSQNIKPNRIDEGNIIFISEEFNTKNKKSILAEGDVVIVRSGVNSGMAAVVNRKYDGANCFSLVIVKVNKTKCNPNYLSYFINSKIGQSYIQKFNFGSAQANFNVSEAIKMPIPIPALGDQARIVNILDIITENIQSKINLFEQYSNLKKGLMNDLLTGKVRVKV